MTIRAKFRCTAVEKIESWRKPADGSMAFLYTAKFAPVGDSSPENKAFWEATPAGSITLSSILPDAFEVGVEYYVDFTAAQS